MKRFLIRMDDACPGMKRAHWDQMEEALDELGIRPIVGVIPENRDPELTSDPPDPEFWARVRRWQDRGWAIALHGLHHRLNRISPGTENLVPLNDRTEFAGLPLGQQAEMLARGVEILGEHGVQPTLWMAPAHSMDTNTLHALRQVTTIRTITDGLGRKPWTDSLGFTWLPQQRWTLPPHSSPFSAIESGVWTICTHPSSLEQKDITRLIQGMRHHRDRLQDDVPDLVERYAGRRRSMGDRAWAGGFLAGRRVIPLLGRLRRRFRER